MQKLLSEFRDFPQVQELIRSLTYQRLSILLHHIVKYYYWYQSSAHMQNNALIPV